MTRGLRERVPSAALARRFGADVRALAALRIAVGALLLVDLALRSRDLVAFYTDAGVLPRAALRESYPGLARVSLHALSGSVAVQAALFLVAGAAALALLAGYRARLATVVSLVLLLSLHARNPLVLNSGDSLLRRLLLWGAFLPLAEVWSVDALRGRTPSAGSGGSDEADPGGSRGGGWRVATLASAGLLCQVAIVYAANAVFKLRSEAWTEGVALRYAFGLDRITVGLGNVVAEHPGLLDAVETAWLAMVVSSVGLLLLTGRARAALAGLFACAHLGMALTMAIGIFPLVSVAALLPFFPPGVWDRVERVGRGIRSRARGRLPGTAPFGRIADRVAGRRGGGRPRVTQARAPDRSRGPLGRHGPTLARWRSRVARAVVAVLLVSMLVWNGATMGYVDLPAGVESVADPEDRRWDMFAEPWRYGGWYVAPGTTGEGREVDAMHGGPVDWEPPPDVADAYPTHRWRMYLVDLIRSGNGNLRPYLAGYLCREYDATHGDRLASVSLYFVELHTRFDGPDEVRRRHLLDHRCSG